MPGRLRQSTAAGESRQEKRYNIAGLEFDETLTWRAGKAIPVADLLSRLQKLSSELRNFDQDQVDPHSFTTLAQDLSNANLLGHKDKGIRAWTVSCIVDVLKLCAPDAPFSNSQLKDIFTVVINSILPALADPTNAYNAQHVYILHSLAEAQSILLVTDIPNSDNLISTLFTNCFDIVSGSGKNAAGMEVSKSVEYHLKNLLSAVVEEVTLPQDVTDIIISQFLRVDARTSPEQSSRGKRNTEAQDDKQANLLLKDYPPAYNMAKSICTTCSEKMSAQITQYFGAVIVDATAATQTNGHPKPANRRISDIEESEDEVEGFADLRKAHRLLRELWRACPDILLNVIPQVEAELSADSIIIRQLATETLGAIAAGIGIAGLAPVIPLDPSAYPLPTIEDMEAIPSTTNPLLTPASPKPFSAVHPSAYQGFLARRHDKSPTIRAAWITAAACILFTAAGGIGLSDSEQEELLSGYAQSLRDHEERVRFAAIKAMKDFTYHGIVNIIGADGGISKTGSVLSVLSDRVTDRKNPVREEAIALLARIWGVASRDIEEGNERVNTVLGDIPKHLLAAYYTNDPHIHAILDKVMFESLLPLSFPPIKVQISRTESQKQRAKAKEDDSQEGAASDADTIRVRRILTLVRSLDTRARPVFFGMQGRQAQMRRGVTAFLKACEDYNGGVVEDDMDEDKVKAQLSTYIEALSKSYPDPAKMAADLWKFAKLHNRRDYQLIRFAMGPEHDYRTMTKAIKELTKRIKEGPTSTQSLIETLNPLLYRCALVVYNRSHVPGIMEISRSDQNGLAEAAHEVLKEISARNPEVLKSHIQALCKELEQTAPSTGKPEESGAADTLKACAAFARRYPSEVTKERKFLVAMTNYALHSKSPRAAKHAVSIVLAVADRKEFYAKEILTEALKDCKASSPNFLARLATISQICLLAPTAANADEDAILHIAVVEVLQKNRNPSNATDVNAWSPNPDEETISKELALKIMVNRCRAEDEKDNKQFESIASPVFKLLMTIISEDGELTKTHDTPPVQRNYLRLIAARFILKLCSHKRSCEERVSPVMFESIAMIVINPPNAVRSGFVNQLKKYLGQNRLNHRWFTVLFLIAFEPDVQLKSSTVTWLKSRVQFFSRQQKQKSTDKKVHQNVMESLFARLLSLLVHHPDYPDRESEDFDSELLDFAKYIVFYLIAVATEDNLSLIFHIAQRVKQTKDGIDDTPEASERLYLLSDLAQAAIRDYAELMPAHAKGVNLLQTWPGSVSLPRSLFKALPSHEVAQGIAEKNYLPEDVALGLEKLVRSFVKSSRGAHAGRKTNAAERKRKSEPIDIGDDDDDDKKVSKRAKKTSLPLRRTPKAKRRNSDVPSSEQPSRKSARVSNAISYAEDDSDDDDAEMKNGHENTRATSSAVKKSKGSTDTAEKADEEDVVMGDGEDDEEADEAEDESEREASPSPLKEKKVAGSKSTSKSKKAISASKAKAEPVKAEPVRGTRQSRRTKA